MTAWAVMGPVDLLTGPLVQYGFMRMWLAAAVIVGVTSAVLSCLLVVRHQALLGDAISHAVLLGVAVGYLVAGRRRRRRLRRWRRSGPCRGAPRSMSLPLRTLTRRDATWPLAVPIEDATRRDLLRLAGAAAFMTACGGGETQPTGATDVSGGTRPYVDATGTAMDIPVRPLREIAPVAALENLVDLETATAEAVERP